MNINTYVFRMKINYSPLIQYNTGIEAMLNISKTTKPLFIYGTQHGTLYNLTPINQPPSENIQAIQLSYSDLHDYVQTFQSLPKGLSLKKFFGISEQTLIYLAPYSFLIKQCMIGCHDNSFVKIKCNKGYTAINAKQYDEMVRIIQPDFFLGLTQYPYLQKQHSSSTNKSLKRAICKTKSYLEKSKYIHRNQIPNQAQNGITNNISSDFQGQRYAAVHGGKNLGLVTRSLEQVLDHYCEGIVVCDLCEGQTIQQRQQTYKTINKRLQLEKNRQGSLYKDKKIKLILSGLGKIQDIEHALQFGYEAFQINQPFLKARQHIALLWKDGKIVNKIPEKHENLNPLDDLCTCKTCRNYSEAYIAHLVECHQLNANIFLSIHNLHVYTEWQKKLNHQ